MKLFKLGLLVAVILGWMALFARRLKAIGMISENPFSHGLGYWAFAILFLIGIFLTILGFMTRPKEMIQMIKQGLFSKN